MKNIISLWVMICFMPSQAHAGEFQASLSTDKNTTSISAEIKDDIRSDNLNILDISYSARGAFKYNHNNFDYNLYGNINFDVMTSYWRVSSKAIIDQSGNKNISLTFSKDINYIGFDHNYSIGVDYDGEKTTLDFSSVSKIDEYTTLKGNFSVSSEDIKLGISFSKSW